MILYKIKVIHLLKKNFFYGHVINWIRENIDVSNFFEFIIIVKS